MSNHNGDGDVSGHEEDGDSDGDCGDNNRQPGYLVWIWTYSCFYLKQI